MNDLPLILILFMTGACIGSFLNCCCDRMIRKESLLTRSRCLKCRHLLQVFDLIPVFSFLFQKGKCRYCKEKIDPFCFYTELSGGIVTLLLYLRFGICKELFGSLMMVCVLFLISLYDAKSMLIPDLGIFLLWILRILDSYFQEETIEILFTKVSGSLFVSILLSAFVFFCEKISKKEMMGKGDLLLIFLLGTFRNLTENTVSIFLSCLIALLYAIPQIKSRQYGCFPFAPAICLAYLIMFLYGKTILHYYSLLFGK